VLGVLAERDIQTSSHMLDLLLGWAKVNPGSESTDMPRHEQTTSSNVAGLETDKVSGEQGGLHDKSSDVLDLGRLLGSLAVQSHPSFGGRVSDGPSDSLEQVSFHCRRAVTYKETGPWHGSDDLSLLTLQERRHIVCGTAHIGQLLDSRDPVLGILKLASDPQSRTPNQLIMLLVNDPLGDVTIDNVEGEVEDFRSESELLVDFNEEIDEIWAHVPLKFGLHVDKLGRGESLVL